MSHCGSCVESPSVLPASSRDVRSIARDALGLTWQVQGSPFAPAHRHRRCLVPIAAISRTANNRITVLPALPCACYPHWLARPANSRVVGQFFHQHLLLLVKSSRNRHEGFRHGGAVKLAREKFKKLEGAAVLAVCNCFSLCGNRQS
jgi:hypothetical protein